MQYNEQGALHLKKKKKKKSSGRPTAEAANRACRTKSTDSQASAGNYLSKWKEEVSSIRIHHPFNCRDTDEMVPRVLVTFHTPLWWHSLSFLMQKKTLTFLNYRCGLWNLGSYFQREFAIVSVGLDNIARKLIPQSRARSDTAKSQVDHSEEKFTAVSAPH